MSDEEDDLFARAANIGASAAFPPDNASGGPTKAFDPFATGGGDNDSKSKKSGKKDSKKDKKSGKKDSKKKSKDKDKKKESSSSSMLGLGDAPPVPGMTSLSGGPSLGLGGAPDLTGGGGGSDGKKDSKKSSKKDSKKSKKDSKKSGKKSSSNKGKGKKSKKDKKKDGGGADGGGSSSGSNNDEEDESGSGGDDEGAAAGDEGGGTAGAADQLSQGTLLALLERWRAVLKEQNVANTALQQAKTNGGGDPTELKHLAAAASGVATQASLAAKEAKEHVKEWSSKVAGDDESAKAELEGVRECAQALASASQLGEELAIAAEADVVRLLREREEQQERVSERVSDLEQVKLRKLDPVLARASNAGSLKTSAEVDEVAEALEAGIRVCEMILGDKSQGVDGTDEVSAARQALEAAVVDAKGQVKMLSELSESKKKQKNAPAPPAVAKRKPRKSDNIPVLASGGGDDSFEDDYEVCVFWWNGQW